MTNDENSVGVSSVFAGKKFPCPICGEKLDIRTDKKEKPYMVCEPCGVQVFVRNRRGIEKLAAKFQPRRFGPIGVFRED